MTTSTALTDTVPVTLADRSYNILVGDGLITEAGHHIAEIAEPGTIIIVTDETVAAIHLETLSKSLAGAGFVPCPIILPAGEGTKSFDQLAGLVDLILDQRPERATPLVALGGGVIGDITGFAASIVLRGIPVIQIPTTLLAQVDSSVGGKTGINTRHGKNLVGAFYQPQLVLADIGSLKTLPPRQLRAGYAEVVKYGLLGDAGFFGWLEDNFKALLGLDTAALTHAVTASCRAKAAIVAADERESGTRALLNLGHTFGHAMEAELGFGSALLHGEAVAIGMVMAFELSVQLGLCQPGDSARVRRHLEMAGLATDIRAISGAAWNGEQLLYHMGQDKKVAHGRIRFVLARSIGEAFLAEDIAPGDVLTMLNSAIAA